MNKIMFTLLLIITAYNFFIASRYIWTLEQEWKKGNFIYGEEMHTLQHISATGITILLSLAMLFGENSDFTLLIYLFYNGALAFILYPHLIGEEIQK